MIQGDQLSREPFLELITNIIKTQTSNQTGFSFAIDGEWGCGKSWILEKLEEDFNKDKQYLIFHYNAWENDYYEDPLIAILSVLIDKLNDIYKQKTLYDAIISNLLKNALDDLIDLSSSISKYFTEIDLKDFIDRKKKCFKKIKSDRRISKDIDKMISLKSTLGKVRETLKKLAENLNIILVIDELDRCLPEYAIKVLERLHHITKDIKILNILAIDEDKLAHSINNVFGNYSSSEEEIKRFSKEYLKKFINLTVPLDNGTAKENDLSVFNGLNELYVPYRKDYCKDDYILSFYKIFFEGMPKRTQERILEKTRLAHELTVASGKTIDCYVNFILCYELIETERFDLGIENDNLEVIISENKTAYIGTTRSLRSDFEINFYKKLRSFTETDFTCDYEKYNPPYAEYPEGTIYYIVGDNDKQLFLNYYLPHLKYTALDGFSRHTTYILEDKKFLEEYKKILKLL